MLDLAWIKDKHLIEQINKNRWRSTPVDEIGIDDAIKFIQTVKKADNMHFAENTASLSRYSRIGLTITPAYLYLRGNNSSRRRRVHPLGLIQYIAASMMISGNTFSLTGDFIQCAKARESDVFYGSLCLYIKELRKLREVIPMDFRDTLNISKIFDAETVKKLPAFTLETDITDFQKLRSIYIDKQIQPIYQDDTNAYTAFWDMMYYRTFCGCFNRYMKQVLFMACGR